MTQHSWGGQGIFCRWLDLMSKNSEFVQHIVMELWFGDTSQDHHYKFLAAERFLSEFFLESDEVCILIANIENSKTIQERCHIYISIICKRYWV